MEDKSIMIILIISSLQNLYILLNNYGTLGINNYLKIKSIFKIVKNSEIDFK
jgi:hypothetical protein